MKNELFSLHAFQLCSTFIQIFLCMHFVMPTIDHARTALSLQTFVNENLCILFFAAHLPRAHDSSVHLLSTVSGRAYFLLPSSPFSYSTLSSFLRFSLFLLSLFSLSFSSAQIFLSISTRHFIRPPTHELLAQR